jgi:hypothetical protein
MSNMRYSAKTLFKQLGMATIVIVLIGGFAAAPSYGQAQTTTSTIKVPFNIDTFHPCMGEIIEVSGNAEFVFHTTLNPDGTRSLRVGHVNTNGVTGTTASGDQVVYSEVDQSVQAERIRNTAGVYHTTVQIRIAANGQEPNILVLFTSTTIINPDGTTKMDNTHAKVKCVGKDT